MIAPAVKPEPREVPLHLIDEPARAARLGMDEDKLDELVGSIRKFGIIQRLILACVGERFEVVAGHRRYLAAVRLQLAAVPADVYPSKEAALEGVKHAENRFREDLSPAEEAAYFDDLLQHEAGGDVDRVCEMVGESFNYVSDRLNLFQGCPVVFEALKDRKIKLGVALELNKVTDEVVRRALLYDCIQGGATVAVARGMVTDWKRSHDLGSTPLAQPESAAPAGPVPQSNYFTCLVCGKSNDIHAMQPHNIHGHCKLAILDPILDNYYGRGDSR